MRCRSPGRASIEELTFLMRPSLLYGEGLNILGVVVDCETCAIDGEVCIPGPAFGIDLRHLLVILPHLKNTDSIMNIKLFD